MRNHDSTGSSKACLAYIRHHGGMTTRLIVTGTEELSPRLKRIWFASPDLSAFADSTQTDRYVKLVFPKPGVVYPHLDVRRLRGEIPAEDLPAVRTYTALMPDVEAGTLAIDFVLHGDSGIAGHWAAHAVPGNELLANGPGSGYSPDSSASWHLLVGDESALPAIGAALGALPSEAVVRVIALVDDAAHEVPLALPSGGTVRWLHRTQHDGASVLRDAVAELEWLPGRVQVFAHGESEQIMKQVRPHLLRERGVPREDTSISAYWRRGASEEGFREWKAAQPRD